MSRISHACSIESKNNAADSFRIILFSVLALIAIPLAANETLEQAQQNTANELSAAEKGQDKINKLDAHTQSMLMDYREASAEIDQLKLYNKQMSDIVDNQNQELSNIQRQITEIEYTERGILPLMQKMLEGLQQFVTLDVPFLAKERQTRVAKLNAMMTRADVTISEKYRRLLEAYQIEVEYGRTLEAYREPNHEQVTHDYLRMGRTALYKVSLDLQQAWLWQQSIKDWKAVDSSHLPGLKKALDVARQTVAPELLTLPMPTLAEAGK